MSQKRLTFIFAFLLVVFLFNLQTFASTEKAKDLAKRAISENQIEAKTAIAELRAMGAEGLEAMFEAYHSEIKNYLEGKDPENWLRIAEALDSTAMQKNSYAARLYWHTDLEKAKAVADKQNKPILSLRLLGNLNEDLSCANSRFFRAILYPNAEISKTLRERYVLHWQRERPVPKVTIDFGDGRKIERTITGNSIHYVLDESGAPLDALPGLNNPKTFIEWLNAAQKLYTDLRSADKKIKPYILKRYHRQRLEKSSAAWREELNRVNLEMSKDENGKVVEKPTALEAGFRTMTKIVTEESILRGIVVNISALEQDTTLEKWKKLAALHESKTQFDANSIALIKRQSKQTDASGKLLENLKTYVTIDTVRNEYLFGTKLHSWFALGEAMDLEKLNDRVYAELFLTPKSDAWLGLYTPEIYVALEND